MHGECLNVVEFKSTENARGKKNRFLYIFIVNIKVHVISFVAQKLLLRKYQFARKYFTSILNKDKV